MGYLLHRNNSENVISNIFILLSPLFYIGLNKSALGHPFLVALFLVKIRNDFKKPTQIVQKQIVVFLINLYRRVFFCLSFRVNFESVFNLNAQFCLFLVRAVCGEACSGGKIELLFFQCS